MLDACTSKNIQTFFDTVTTAINDLLHRMHERLLDDPKGSIDFTRELADTLFRVLLEAVLSSKMCASHRATFHKKTAPS